MKKYSDITLWKNITESEWTDWKWQLSHCISTLNDLSQVVSLSAEEYKGVEEATKALKMRISPHIALMMANGEDGDTLRNQFVPSLNEVRTANVDILYSEVNDDNGYSPVKGLVHRYPTKVLGHLYPPTPTSWPWCSPVLRHIKFARPMGLLFH